MVTATQTQLTNPFPGLRPFRFEESHLYFGRERHTKHTIRRLLENNFLSIVGASGVGKSSFVYCGIVHTLLQDYQRQESWRVLATSPADTPLMRLAKTVAPLTTLSIAEIYEQFCNDEKSLAKIFEDAYQNNHEQYLLFLDQFEEIFRHSETRLGNTNEATQYIQLILRTIKQPDLKAYVIITMRSEFLDHCTQYPGLAQYLNQSQFILPRMTRDEIVEALAKPIALLGAEIEPNLVERVLQDTGEGTDQLPIIQHAMMRTWERWSRTSGLAGLPVGIGDYEAIGTAKKALSVHANEVYAKLTDKEKKICSTVFKTITEKGAEGRGVRRPTKLGVITEIAEAPIGEVAQVIHAFRQNGNELLMPSQETPLEEDTVVDISHESLMRIWEELSLWADQEADSVKTYIGLAEAAEENQTGKDGLLKQPKLQVTLDWYKREHPTKAWAIRHEPSFERAMLFLNASQEDYEKEQINKEKAQKRKVAAARGIAIGSVVAVIICVLFLLYALYQSQEATKALGKAKIAEADATEKSKQAKKEKDKADVEAKKASKAEKEAKVALVEAEEAKLRAEKEKLVAEQAKLEAEVAGRIARGERDNAQKQMKIAEISRQVSDINSQLASLAQQKANNALEEVANMQKLSTAKSLAIKSLRFAELDLQATAAQQAYRMNVRYNGKPNDPDIYQGLYYAIKNLKAKDNPRFNELAGHKSTVRSLVNANGLVYSTGSDGKVLAFDLNNKKYIEASTITATPIAQVQQINRAMAVASNGMVALAGEYSEILVLQNGAVVKRLPHNAREIWALGFAPDNKTLIGIDNQYSVSTWNITDAAPTPKQILKSTEKINALTINSKQANFAIGKESGEIVLLDLNGSVIKNWRNNDAITSLAFNNAGDRIASGDEGGVLNMWNLQGTNKDNQKEHRARINHIVFSQDGNSLASASFDRTVRIWNAKKLNELPIVLDDHNDWVWAIAFSPDGKKLLAGCRDNVLRVWATQVEDMKDIICPELTTQNRKKELDAEQWERFIYKPEKGEKLACTCCQ
jgi:hypothetical protein